MIFPTKKKKCAYDMICFVLALLLRGTILNGNYDQGPILQIYPVGRCPITTQETTPNEINEDRF